MSLSNDVSVNIDNCKSYNTDITRNRAESIDININQCDYKNQTPEDNKIQSIKVNTNSYTHEFYSNFEIYWPKVSIDILKINI